MYYSISKESNIRYKLFSRLILRISCKVSKTSSSLSSNHRNLCIRTQTLGRVADPIYDALALFFFVGTIVIFYGYLD